MHGPMYIKFLAYDGMLDIFFQNKEESVWKYTINKVDGIKTPKCNNHETHITFFF